MEGTNTIHLLHGESFKQRKQFILDCIKVARELMHTVNRVLKTCGNPQLEEVCFEILAKEQAYIKSNIGELVKLKKWWEATGKQQAVDKLAKNTPPMYHSK